MHRNQKTLITFSSLLILALLFTACAPTVVESTEVSENQEATLTLAGSGGEEVIALEKLKTLPATEGQAGIVSSTGKITIPELYKGVAVKDLVEYLNIPFDPTMGVAITAEDGYSMTLSYDQVLNGSFIAYDPSDGKELPLHDPLTVIIAYERAGQPLNSKEEGSFRLMVVSEKNNQIVDGHWSVKWVNKMEVKTVGDTWALDVNGALSSTVTRDSFESCGSPSCHGKTYQDENGQNWLGVPLWILVGDVDDADDHSETAYNVELAEEGYDIDLINEDGEMVTLDGSAIIKDNQVILANKVNDAELPDLFFPLRLVGTNVDQKMMLGKISEIVVDVPPILAATAEPVADNDGEVTLTGLVNTETVIKDAELRSYESMTITAEGKDGPQDFTGVSLNMLLETAGVKSDATKLVFTAADGYAAEVSLEDVKNNPNSMLAFMETPGEYMIVIPGSPTSSWVKTVVKIELK